MASSVHVHNCTLTSHHVALQESIGKNAADPTTATAARLSVRIKVGASENGSVELEVGILEVSANSQVSLGKGLGVDDASHLLQSQLAGDFVLNHLEVAVVLVEEADSRLVDLVRVLVVTGLRAVVKLEHLVFLALALALACVLGGDIGRDQAAGARAGRGIWSLGEAVTCLGAMIVVFEAGAVAAAALAEILGVLVCLLGHIHHELNEPKSVCGEV